MDLISMPKIYEVFYARDFDPYCELEVDKNNPELTHAHILDQAAHDLEELYVWMQAENWSRNGEGRPFIEAARGVHHTSMSVGDMAREKYSRRLFRCRNNGWEEIE